MNKRIPPKKLSPADVAEILKLTKKDITATKLKQYFACFYGHDQARFQPNDTFTLMPNNPKCYNDKAVETTIGRYIYNIFAMPIPYLKKFGYMNDELTTNNIGTMEQRMALMILNDELTTKEYAEYMDCSEWIAMNTCYYITPSLDDTVVLPIPEVMKKKDELFTKYKKEIDESDMNVTTIIEKELVSDAKKHIEAIDDPAYDGYKSGAYKFDVNYKKNSIMVGAIADPSDGKIHILKSNYVDGISPDEYEKTAMLSVIGGYSRGVATQKYGYESKKYNASLQNVQVDIDGTNIDCGTDRYLEIVIPAPLKNMFIYRYIIEGGKLVELTPDNISQYAGKSVKLRSPMFCKTDQICQHCAGTIFKRMDLKDAGLVGSNLTGNLLNLSMKKFHDSTVKVNKIDVEQFIKER